MRNSVSSSSEISGRTETVAAMTCPFLFFLEAVAA
jgi:hypothetical protein